MIHRKTVLLMALTVVLVFSACSKIQAQKANPESDFEAKNIDGDKAIEITKYVGVTQNVIIPSKIRGLPVTHIGRTAFELKDLTSITIPNNVTHIEGGAFVFSFVVANVSNHLTSITIGSNVELSAASGDYGTLASFGLNGFETTYNNGGKLAGTYTRPNTESKVWTRN